MPKAAPSAGDVPAASLPLRALLAALAGALLAAPLRR